MLALIFLRNLSSCSVSFNSVVGDHNILVYIHFGVNYVFVFALNTYNWALTVDINAHLTLKPLPEACSKPELVRANTPKMVFDDDYTLSEALS